MGFLGRRHQACPVRSHLWAVSPSSPQASPAPLSPGSLATRRELPRGDTEHATGRGHGCSPEEGPAPGDRAVKPEEVGAGRVLRTRSKAQEVSEDQRLPDGGRRRGCSEPVLCGPHCDRGGAPGMPGAAPRWVTERPRRASRALGAPAGQGDVCQTLEEGKTGWGADGETPNPSAQTGGGSRGTGGSRLSRRGMGRAGSSEASGSGAPRWAKEVPSPRRREQGGGQPWQ